MPLLQQGVLDHQRTEPLLVDATRPECFVAMAAKRERCFDIADGPGLGLADGLGLGLAEAYCLAASEEAQHLDPDY